MYNSLKKCTMFSSRNFFSYILLILFIFGPHQAWAEVTIAPELYISSKGIADIRGAQVIAIHALNLISVGIWGQKWTVNMDYTTKFVSSDGAEIKPEQIATGHILEIKAIPSRQQQGLLEASFVRDLSLGAGSAASSGASLLDSICRVLTPSPSPSPSVSSFPRSVTSPSPFSSFSGVLTGMIALGAKGQDVTILQEFLQKKGFGIPDDGPVTGYFGKVTEAAVKKFQEANGLEAVGNVGAKTRALINSFLNMR